MDPLPVWFRSDIIPSCIGFLTGFTGSHLTNLGIAYAPGYVQGEANKGKATMIIYVCTCIGLVVGSAFVFLVPFLLNP